MNRHFSKESIQMDNKHMKRYLTSMVIREMQTKNKSNHFASTRMAIIKKSDNNKC